MDGRMDVLSDPSGRLTIDDITSPETASRFKPVSTRFYGGFTKATVWLRFTLRRMDEKTDAKWWLEIYPPFLDYVTLYEPAGPGAGSASYREKNEGRLLPLRTREIAARNFVFETHLADTAPHTYYMRVQSAGTLFVDAALWTPRAFARASNTASMLLGGFYGIAFLITLLNLIFWFILRDRLFIVYSLFVVTLSIIWVTGNGYASLYLLPDSPRAVFLINAISIPCLFITGSLLIEMLIPLDKKSFWRRSFTAVRAFAVFSIAAAMAGQFGLIAGLQNLVGLYLASACIIVSIIGIYRRVPSAKLYAITFIVYYGGGIMIAIRNTNLFGLARPFMDNTLQIGTALHMLLIQIAVAKRFFNIEQERKDARQKMETEMVRSQKLQSLAVLAGGIAHDFNNMLTIIMSTVTLARLYAKDNAGAIGKLQECEQEIMHARDLTNQLLTFAKGGAPIKELSSLSELLRDTVEFSLKGTPVQSVFSIPDNLWHAEIDRTQISQVISNLTINASQAMPQGGVLKVGAGNVLIGERDALPLPPGRCVRLSFEDSGAGIPAENLSKVFDPFFTTKADGSGLGLATCYSIVKRHKGHIQLKSEVGAGSVFSVYLPASFDTPGEKREADKEILKGTARVLLMDDDEKLLKNLDELLGSIGYDVETAANGENAVILYERALAQARPFDAVVFDLTVIGGMGGRACLQEILTLDPCAKAVVMSGYSEDAALPEYRRYGFREAITKPFTVRELHRTLQKVITGAAEGNEQ